MTWTNSQVGIVCCVGGQRRSFKPVESNLWSGEGKLWSGEGNLSSGESNLWSGEGKLWSGEGKLWSGEGNLWPFFLRPGEIRSNTKNK